MSRSVLPLLSIVVFVLVLTTTTEAQGRCRYNACNFNRNTTSSRYHGLLSYFCRRCCTDISRVVGQKSVARNSIITGLRLRLNPRAGTAIRDMKRFLETIVNRVRAGASRREIAERLRQARGFLEQRVESIENIVEDSVFDSVDNAVTNMLSTADRAWEIAEGIQGGWDIGAVIELMGAIVEAGGYALELIGLFAAILA